jgi:ArsR family transcriptional regulator, arsenate/arsenite/antimonite-responsive transcriptional repressor
MRTQLTEKDAKRQERLLKALADRYRLRILSLLKVDDGTMSVNDIVSCFNLKQPTISHHLRVLCDAGLVTYTKRGTSAYYRIETGTLIEAYDAIRGLLPTQSMQERSAC